MKYSIVVNNKVVERIVSDEAFASARADELGGTYTDDVNAQVGYELIDSVWTPPPRHDTKEDARDDKIDKIENKAESVLGLGAPYNSTRFPVESRHQLQVTAISTSIANGRGLPRGVTNQVVRDISRNKVEMSGSEYMDYATALRDYVAQVEQNAEDHVDAVLALYADDTKTINDIDSYDISKGWPS